MKYSHILTCVVSAVAEAYMAIVGTQPEQKTGYMVSNVCVIQDKKSIKCLHIYT